MFVLGRMFQDIVALFAVLPALDDLLQQSLHKTPSARPTVSDIVAGTHKTNRDVTSFTAACAFQPLLGYKVQRRVHALCALELVVARSLFSR